MTNIVFAWELGTNLGHLERDLPLAQRLRQQGADVRFVVANLQTAEKLLTPQGFAFLPGPAILRANRRPVRSINASELLLNFGYDDVEVVTALIRTWLELWKLMKPDVIVTDYAPMAMLSARIAGIPTLPVGPGFCVPPNRNPMPAFLEQDRQSAAALRAADEKLLTVINQAAKVFGHTAFECVGALFENPAAQITSFPELDPYGPRTAAHYVGPITDGGRHPQVQWSGNRKVRVFAYLQASMVGLEIALGALRQPDIEVICVVPRAAASIVGRFKSEGFRLTTESVDLGTLLPTVDAVVNYSSAGVVAAALQAGVPLLLFPSHLEQQLTAERAAGLGAAVVCSGAITRDKVISALSSLLNKPAYKTAARAFAEKYRNYRHEPAINAVAEAIACHGRQTGNSPEALRLDLM